MASARPSAKKPDLEAIRAEMVRLGASEELCRLVLGLLDSMAEQNLNLQNRLETALRLLWRPKSEKVSPDQLALFLSKLPAMAAGTADETPAPSPDAAPPIGAKYDDADAAGSDDSKARKPHGKRAFPPHLPRRSVEVKVPEDLRRCACGAEKVCIGHETQVLWEFEPATFCLVERRLEKLACKRCEEGVTTAPAPGKPIEGGRPGPGLLAQLVAAKEHDGLPLNRQSDIYKRGGIHLAPSTLGDWHAHAADLFEPVYKHLRKQTLASYLISLDDTRLPVLDRDDPRGIKRGHLWTYLGDEARVGFCEYTPTWSGVEPCRILREFTGKVIQGDGYAGIDDVFTGPDPPKRAGCMDHARRRFVKAMEAGDARAAMVVKLLAEVYLVEAAARKEPLSHEALLLRRQQLSKPIMDRLKTIIAELNAAVVPKSPLGKATTYAINQWETLVLFLEDGRIPLSNAHVERQQRRTAWGRKAYLFAGNDAGARRLAILQTAVVNCELLGISIWHYLRDTYQRLADGWPQSRIEDLTPAAWAAAQHEAQQT